MNRRTALIRRGDRLQKLGDLVVFYGQIADSRRDTATVIRMTGRLLAITEALAQVTGDLLALEARGE